MNKEIKYKEFNFFDIFDRNYKTGNSKITECKDGNLPLISTTQNNNGITKYIVYNNKDKLFTKNSITLAKNGTVGSMFYQKQDFCATSDILILKLLNNNFSKYVILYIITTFENYFKLYYSWNDKITINKVLPNIYVKLPIKENGEIDFEYMELYMKNIETKIKNKLNILKNMANIKNAININQWKSIFLKDLFKIDYGSKLDKSKMIDINPKINFVGRSGINNGVTLKVDRIENKIPYKNGLLTLSLGGAYIGSCFIQKEDFYTSQNVVVLIPINTDITYNQKQFIATLIFKTSQLYYKAFIDELNRHLKTDFCFLTPFKNNQIDFSYMESYMKTIEEKTKNKLNLFKIIV